VRWVGQDPTYEVQAFHELNAAKSVDEAFTALAKFGVGAQNFNIGDVDGHIGYYPHAFVPLRNLSATCVPWLPMPGTTSACDWQADASGNVKFIPDDQLPQEKDPSKGYIATANNDVTGALLPPAPGADANPLTAQPTYLYAYTDPGFRAARLQGQLEASTQHSLDTTTALQADVHSLLAETMMPGLLKLLEGQPLSAGAQAVVQLWKGWDFSTPTGLGGSAGAASASAASTAFHAFLKRFAQQTVARALDGTGVDATQLPTEQVMKILVGLTQGVAGATPASTYPLAAPPATWCKGSCSTAAASALEGTVTFVAQRLAATDPSAWRWGALHQVLFESPVRPLLSDFGPFPNDGGLYTVDVANFDLWSDDFLQTAGPNVRMATELAPGAVRSRMVIPGGESDRPPIFATGDNPHYEDQIPAWLANGPGDQPYSDDEVRRAAQGKIVITR
jgi:penicillin amidase